MLKSKVMLVEADVLALRHFHREIPDADQVLVCSQTEPVVELFLGFRPDVLVIGPTALNAEELIRKIRTLPEGQRVPVLTLHPAEINSPVLCP